VRKVIIDPYDWMPGYGESGVSFHSSGAYMVLEITYDEWDTETQKGTGLLKRAMRFSFARYFIRTPFPGANPFRPESMPGRLSTDQVEAALEEARVPPTGREFGCLVEIEGSRFVEVCKAWYRREAHGYSPNFRHFQIEFLSENEMFHIIAEDVTLSEPVRVTSAYE